MFLNDNGNDVATEIMIKAVIKMNSNINLSDMAAMSDAVNLAEKIDFELVSQADWLDDLNNDNVA